MDGPCITSARYGEADAHAPVHRVYNFAALGCIDFETGHAAPQSLFEYKIAFRRLALTYVSLALETPEYTKIISDQREVSRANVDVEYIFLDFRLSRSKG